MSKIIVDIPDEQFERIVYFDVVRLRNTITSGLKLPENATQGDVIVTLFKPFKVFKNELEVRVYLTEVDFASANPQMIFTPEWWDAEYIQEVQEDVTE